MLRILLLLAISLVIIVATGTTGDIDRPGATDGAPLDHATLANVADELDDAADQNDAEDDAEDNDGTDNMDDTDDVSLQLGFLFVNYYGTDLKELERRAAWISEYDLAVALHLVKLAGADLDDIVAWRREGSSWDAITRRCQLGCEAFYVAMPAEKKLPAPYARPYAAWRARPGADMRLTDEEVRELVILAAMSEHCKLPPAEVVQLRSAGQTPRAIVAMHPTVHDMHDTHDTAPPLPADPDSEAGARH